MVNSKTRPGLHILICVNIPCSEVLHVALHVKIPWNTEYYFEFVLLYARSKILILPKTTGTQVLSNLVTMVYFFEINCIPTYKLQHKYIRS